RGTPDVGAGAVTLDERDDRVVRHVQGTVLNGDLGAAFGRVEYGFGHGRFSGSDVSRRDAPQARVKRLPLSKIGPALSCVTLNAAVGRAARRCGCAVRYSVPRPSAAPLAPTPSRRRVLVVPR